MAFVVVRVQSGVFVGRYASYERWGMSATGAIARCLLRPAPCPRERSFAVGERINVPLVIKFYEESAGKRRRAPQQSPDHERAAGILAMVLKYLTHQGDSDERVF